VIGQTQRQRTAKKVDEAEHYFANTAKTYVGVEIPKQTKADD